LLMNQDRDRTPTTSIPNPMQSRSVYSSGAVNEAILNAIIDAEGRSQRWMTEEVQSMHSEFRQSLADTEVQNQNRMAEQAKSITGLQHSMKMFFEDVLQRFEGFTKELGDLRLNLDPTVERAENMSQRNISHSPCEIPPRPLWR
jgi:hypothetical protein